MLQCEGVSYDSILDGVSFRVSAGEIVALIGPNGAGKSTLMKVLARIYRESAGGVFFEGRALSRFRARERARRIGYLPQETRIDVGYSVRDVAAMGFYSHAEPPSDKRLGDLLEQVGLTAFADRDIRTLSGGERQRALLAKVLAQDADLLLLDEPVSGLDAGYQLDLLEICAGLARSGKAIVIALHELEYVLRYADRVLLLAGGRLAAAGRPDRVLTSPAFGEAFGLEASVFSDPVTGVPRLSLTRLVQGRISSESAAGFLNGRAGSVAEPISVKG